MKTIIKNNIEFDLIESSVKGKEYKFNILFFNKSISNKNLNISLCIKYPNTDTIFITDLKYKISILKNEE